MKRPILNILLTGSLFCILSFSAIADEEILQLLADEIENRVVEGDKETARILLQEVTEVASAMPGWVDENLAMVSGVNDDQLADFEMLQELNGEVETLLNLGDFESAAELAEGAYLLSQEAFGEAHWLTVVAARDLGIAAANMGDVETADTFLNEALVISSEILGEAHPETQQMMEILSELYAAAGAFEESLAFGELITANYKAELGGWHLLTLNSMINQSLTYDMAGDMLGAAEMLHAVCGMFSASLTVYHEETIKCELDLAALLRETSQLDESVASYQRVISNIEATSDGVSSFALTSMANLAVIHELRGEYESGKELLSGVINTARLIGDEPLSYTGRNYLGRILVAEGELVNARVVLEEVVRYGQTAWQDDPLSYYNSLLELGSVYQRQANFDMAEGLYEESMLALLEIAGESHPSTLVAINNLGGIYEQLGLYDDAEPLLKQALEGMEQTFGPSHHQTASVRNNLALLHESQGNFREAEPLYLTSYEHLVEEFGDNHPRAIAIQNNLAFLYMMIEDDEAAAAMFADLAERWTIVLGPDHQDTLKGRNNLGRAFHKLDMLDEAEQEIYTAMLARRENLGARHIDTIRSLIDLGSVYLDQGRLDAAASELTLALEIAEEEIGDHHPYTFEALNALAKVLEAQGNLEDAVQLREVGLARRSEFLDRMLWVTGENAREGYIRLHQPELHDYLALLTRSDDPERGRKAIEASLQRKGLLLKITSEIEQIAQLSQDPGLSSISAALESARKDLAALTLSGPTAATQGRHAEALYDLELRVNDLQGELGGASVRYRSSIAAVTARTLADSLTDNAALVDYLMYDDGEDGKVLAGVIVKEDGEVRYELVQFDNRAEIEASVLEFREIIQDDLADEEDLMEIGMIAHDLVWQPVVDEIEGIEYVYLVPDGVLNILPFNALINENEDYLIQTTDLHILTSGRDLLPNEYELARGEYVILAGPDYNADQIVSAAEIAEAAGRRSAALKLGVRVAGGGLRGLNFAPLPGAEEEGRIIADRVSANKEESAVYIGEAAQEQVLSAITDTPEILHMATHGFFLEADDTLRKRLLKMQRSAEIQAPPPGDNPLLRAGLAFAGFNANAQFLGDIDTINDGVLTALEVLGLDLSGTRLVVLSACETGLGEVHEGEGVYGLRRSFQEAGVAEVISSLWEVSDAGTQALMTDLYDRILEGMPAREALRAAQLDMIDSPEWGYPYIWSAFMIVGSYESAGITFGRSG